MRKSPGDVRDAVLRSLNGRTEGATVSEIALSVGESIGATAASSIRSYLRINTPRLFSRKGRGRYVLRSEFVSPDSQVHAEEREFPSNAVGKAKLVKADCLDWLDAQPPNSLHAVVTDPPYGLIEYSEAEQAKLRAGRGGVWRIPPSFDGTIRSPLPRFTVLTPRDLTALDEFFASWAKRISRVVVPGANILVASNPLLSAAVSSALTRGGLERRGEIVRLVMTMRGGDRPKAAHEEFANVSVMPRSMWEPWLVFRKPLDGTARDNLRKWGTGGFRRPSEDRPFGDVIASAPTRAQERALAPHPSLKPQSFLRTIVRAALPLGRGIVLDCFAGSGSTLAAANFVGYDSVGIERDESYFDLAVKAIPKLERIKVS